jgi:hypothetical protein
MHCRNTSNKTNQVPIVVSDHRHLPQAAANSHMEAYVAQDSSSGGGPYADEFVNRPHHQAHNFATNPAGDQAILECTQSAHIEDTYRPGEQAHDCCGHEGRKHVDLAVQVSHNPSPMPT